MRNITLNKILLTLAVFVSTLQLATAQQQVTNTPVTTYPYTESFEQSTNAWVLNVGGNDFNWARSQGNTATEPTKATEGQHYMYIDAGSTANLNKKATFQSRTFDLTSLNKPNLIFAFHLLSGSNSAGTLEIEASTDGFTWNKVWSTDGNSTTGSGWTAPMSAHGNLWQEAIVNLSAYKSANTQLRFVGNVTSTWANYIAIDAITITEEGAPAITGFTPTTGFAGSFITINGVGLDWSAEIKFNGVTYPSPASHPYIDYSYIYANLYAPEGATTGKITVTANGQTATSMTDFEIPSMVSTFPYKESFEIGASGSLTISEGSWFRREGWYVEPYWSTKPNSPSEGFSYMTVTNQGQKSSLTSLLVDVSKLKNPTITFDYHMTVWLRVPSDNVYRNILTLETSTDGGTTWKPVWERVCTQHLGATSGWETASVSLKEYKHTQVLLRFSGTRSQAWSDDVSLDNVTIKDVPVLGQPVADFQVEPSAALVGENVKYNNNSQNAVTYLWQFEGANITSSTEENPTVKYNAAGAYQTTLTVYNSVGDSATKTMTVTVQEATNQLVADFKVSTTEIWEGESLKFNNESKNATSYLWKYSSGYSEQTSTEEHLTVKYDVPGAYHVILVAYNELGQGTSKTMAITVKARPKMPVADFKVSTTEIWQGESLKFSNESQHATSYVWRFTNGLSDRTSTVEHLTVKYDLAGTFYVRLIAYNDFGQSTATMMTITVKERPIVPVAEFKVSTTEIWEGESLKFNNESQNASRYEWKFEGGDIVTSTDTHPIVKYNTPGNHLVTLIAYNDHNQTAVKYMRISVLERATARTTHNATTTTLVDVKVYSKTGALLKTTKIAENAPPAKSLKGLQNGVYFVHVTTKTGVQKYQIIKQD